MAETPSNMLPLGTKAPNFILPDTVSGNTLSLDELRAKAGLVVMFICNHCPYVIHVQEEMVKIASEYQSKGFSFVAISSNDVNGYPQDGPEKMKEHAIKNEFTFPYLYDETQNVAKAYDAACTPDFYVFTADLSLYYRGRIDGSRPNNEQPVTGEDLRGALNSLLDGQPSPSQQWPSMGCNIKWK
ncbi:MAG: thioredoxin family protein [Cyclobacteriaceae bacterium]